MTFDLEKVREANHDYLDLQYQLDSAEAEIERLRAENEGLSKAVIDIQEERDLAQAEFRSYHRAWEEQAARAQELEEALVEMVATNPCNIPTLCDVVHDELMCPALDGNCDFWKGCPQKNELREAARKQLQAEGKIGPDARPKCDHAWQAAIEERGYQTCLKCGECRNIEDIPRTAPAWQITEERKAAIKELSELLTAIGCPSCHYYIQKNYGENITVLRAMLTEAAGQ